MRNPLITPQAGDWLGIADPTTDRTKARWLVLVQEVSGDTVRMSQFEGQDEATATPIVMSLREYQQLVQEREAQVLTQVPSLHDVEGEDPVEQVFG